MYMVNNEGVSVNTWLYKLELMDEYYTYINRKDEKAVIGVLAQAEFSIEQATEIVQGLLNNSQFDDL